jgi:hypothetical protein
MQLRYRLEREHLDVSPAGRDAAAAFFNQILYGLSIDAGIASVRIDKPSCLKY